MSNIDRQVGARIRLYRKMLGLSQTDLGEKIGVRFQQVQKYESGANRVAASRLWKIADALGVKVQALFQDVLEISETADKSDEILELFNNLPAAQQDQVIKLARRLVAENTAPKKSHPADAR